MLFEVWLSGCTSVLSPPPLQPRPILATRRTHLKLFAYGADTSSWLGRWKHSASGLPYQWRQCCVTHRQRTSCSTTLLLFLFQTAAITLSFFFPSSLFCRCEKEVWGWPVVHTFKYLCTPLNAPWIIARFHFSSIFFLIFIGYVDHDFGYNYGRCHPVSLRSVMNYSPPLLTRYFWEFFCLWCTQFYCIVKSKVTFLSAHLTY